MDIPCKFTNRNNRLINHMKCLVVAALFTLAAPVFADDCFIELEAGDLDSALIVCNKAAEQGDANAQNNLGMMYDNGLGTSQDYKQALYWFTKAAEQGLLSAQYNLGVMYDNGQGTPKNYKQAIYWYTKAAEQGEAKAQYKLGFMYYNGEGTPKNNVLAYVWWNIAAAQGHESAASNRGNLEELMTPNQIAEAQKLSKEYYAKYAK
jgi:TPR repeat protein